MKILLIGNYKNLKSQSMNRYANVLKDGLEKIGHQVCLLKPTLLFGKFIQSSTGIGKWIGYIDRFILFRPNLNRAVEQADIVHICDQANSIYLPWLNGKPHIITCHDLLAIKSALGLCSYQNIGLTGKIYQRWILFNLKKAFHIVCVSKKTRDDLLSISGVPSSKISLVHNGLNYSYRPMRKNKRIQHLEQMKLDKNIPFLLHVGNNNWYKNKIGLLEIFAEFVKQYKNKTIKLVIAGSPLNFHQKKFLISYRIDNLVIETSQINNEKLRALYSAAEALIFPSLAEGFGWPIIQAQACGCPVFSSNRKPMTEIGGEGAIYFDPINISKAADTIIEGLSNRTLMIQRGFSNSKKYSTETMIKSYNNLMSRKFFEKMSGH
jgi:glycosyltransferase involved in cell wall biosynthesis